MRRRSSTGSAWVTSSPSRKMRPPVGSISRLIIFSVVVLPHPDGPTSTQSSPSGTSSESSRRRAGRSGTACVTASRRIIGSVGELAEVIRGRYRADAHHALASSRCSPLVLAEDIGPKWLYWPWVSDHTRRDPRAAAGAPRAHAARGRLRAADRAAARAPGVRYRRLYGPVLAVTGVLYTIPSLALFALLLPFTGLSRTTAVIPLDAYTLLILVRNIVAGPRRRAREVQEAADGHGVLAAAPAAARRAAARAARDHRRHPHRHGHHDRPRRPSPRSSARAGSASCMLDGFNRDFRTPLTVGIVLSLALAVVADLLLVGAQRLATPWRRRRSTRSRCVMELPRRRLRLPRQRATSGTATRASRRLLCQHVQLTVVSVLVAALIALPIGIVLGHLRTAARSRSTSPTSGARCPRSRC